MKTSRKTEAALQVKILNSPGCDAIHDCVWVTETWLKMWDREYIRVMTWPPNIQTTAAYLVLLPGETPTSHHDYAITVPAAEDLPLWRCRAWRFPLAACDSPRRAGARCRVYSGDKDVLLCSHWKERSLFTNLNAWKAKSDVKINISTVSPERRALPGADICWFEP